MQYLSDENFKSITDRIVRLVNFCNELFTENNARFDRDEIVDKVFDMDARRQRDIFIDMYTYHRDDIINGHEDVNWIQSDQNMTIFIDPDTSIDLSKVYSLACRYSVTAGKLQRKLKNVSDEKKYDLFYPKIFQYLLYSCLVCFCGKDDRQQIRDITQQIKNHITTFGVNASSSSSPFEGISSFPAALNSILDIVTADKRVSSLLNRSNIPLQNVIKNVTGAFENSDKNSDMSTIIKNVIGALPLEEVMDGNGSDEDSKSEGKEKKPETAKSDEAPQLAAVNADESAEVFDL